MARLTHNSYDLIVDALAVYEHSLEIEADDKLYVRPSLSVTELLTLHVLECCPLANGRPGKLRDAAFSLKLSEPRMSAIAARLREIGALDKSNKPTSTIGVPGARTVQYVHRAWAAGYFQSLLPARKYEELLRIDRHRLLPGLYVALVDLLHALDERLTKIGVGVGREHAMLMVLIADFTEDQRRSPSLRELASLTRVKSSQVYERVDRLRGLGLLTKLDLDMTSAGKEAAKAARNAGSEWAVDIRARLLDP